MWAWKFGHQILPSKVQRGMRERLEKERERRKEKERRQREKEQETEALQKPKVRFNEIRRESR